MSLELRCVDTLRQRIAAQLAVFERVHDASGHDRAAAVALAVTDEAHGGDLDGLPRHEHWQDSAALVLTKRSSRLRSHPGQWALPGGRVDAGEAPEDTALRELEEEIGIVLVRSAVLGRLDDFVTRSGFAITPVVVWAGPRERFAANPDEVDSIHRIPLAEFLRADAPLLDHAEIAGASAPVLRMPVGDSWIAAPTAAILYQFREVCLLGRSTRVAHFEQPAFAWR